MRAKRCHRDQTFAVFIMVSAGIHYPQASIFWLVLATAVGAMQSVEAASITYMGVIYDRTDFARLNIGNAGYWFPQFEAPNPVEIRPTGENVRDALPSWAGPLNHATSVFDPNYATRTFSQDGPARSKGGQPAWNTLKLPDGEIGLSGAIVDPHTAGNSNNTLNRIQLNAGVPSTFYFHVVTDNTNLEHDPTNRLRARGNAGGVDLEANTYPQTAQLAFNGVADIYTFRYDGFAGGDFIKLQLNGDAADEGASFAGFMFDETFAPTPGTPGDFNDDGIVDAADYVDWRKRTGPPSDYDAWKVNFGQGSSGGAAAAFGLGTVPEPSSLLLMLMLASSAPRRGKQLRRRRKAKSAREGRHGSKQADMFKLLVSANSSQCTIATTSTRPPAAAGNCAEHQQRRARRLRHDHDAGKGRKAAGRRSRSDSNEVVQTDVGEAECPGIRDAVDANRRLADTHTIGQCFGVHLLAIADVCWWTSSISEAHPLPDLLIVVCPTAIIGDDPHPKIIGRSGQDPDENFLSGRSRSRDRINGLPRAARCPVWQRQQIEVRLAAGRVGRDGGRIFLE
jgi:hypothetical protein